jgi:hypothetical protein
MRLIHVRHDIIVFFVFCKNLKMVNFLTKSLASRTVEEKQWIHFTTDSVAIGRMSAPAEISCLSTVALCIYSACLDVTFHRKYLYCMISGRHVVNIRIHWTAYLAAQHAANTCQLPNTIWHSHGFLISDWRQYGATSGIRHQSRPNVSLGQ